MPDQPAILLDDLFVSYGAVEAVGGVSLQVARGEVFGLLGPNGAGKTSILRVLTTLVRPAAGRAAILGNGVVEAAATVRRLIGYVPQVLSTDGALTGRENLALSADLYQVRWRQRRERVTELLEVVGLTAVADDLVRTYSGGMVRRLEIACALLGAPRVLLLDEPTLGLDPLARRAVWQLVHDARAADGMTVLTTTHDLEEADEHCGQLAVMSGGRILGAGTPEELRAQAGLPGGTLEDVFGALAGEPLEVRGGLREVNRVRRTARRLG